MRADIRRKPAPPKRIYETVTYRYTTITSKEEHMQKMYSHGWRFKSEELINRGQTEVSHFDTKINITEATFDVTYFR